MTKTTDRNLIVGLDIGTTKVAALVGEVLPDGEINIVGLGTHAARGMDKGGVNDLESVVKSLQRAVDEAEMMADCPISITSAPRRRPAAMCGWCRWLGEQTATMSSASYNFV